MTLKEAKDYRVLARCVSLFGAFCLYPAFNVEYSDLIDAQYAVAGGATIAAGGMMWPRAREAVRRTA